MADKKPIETGKQRRVRLFNALLENIDRQLDIDQKLKENMEILFNYTSKSTTSDTMQEKVIAIRELYIETESLQGEGRAIFHRLFGTKFED
jgi:hypothetical protein